MGKGCLWIIGIFFFIGIISSIVSSCEDSRNRRHIQQRQQAQQTQQTQRSNLIRAIPSDVQSSRLDVLTGIYTGTRTTNRGPVGWTMMVFKNQNRYEFVIYTFPSNRGPRTRHSYIGNINFNTNTNRYEFQGQRYLQSPARDDFFQPSSGFGFWSCVLSNNNNTLTGYNLDDRNTTFTLNRIQTSAYKYTGPHTHIPGANSRVTTQSTCQREGVRTFTCIICDVQSTVSIPKVAHTLNNNRRIIENSTCSTEGTQAGYCRVCNTEIDRQPLPRAPHRLNPSWVKTEDPNCNQPGTEVQFCFDCNDIVNTREIPPITNNPHEIISTHIKGNIFVAPIVTEHKCTICDYINVDEDYSKVWLTPLIFLSIGFILIFSSIIYLRVKNIFICPYCFKKLDKRKITYICKNAGCGIKYFTNVFGKKTSTCKKADCNGMLVPHCPDPNCEREIVQEAIDLPSIPITIMGTSQSGKTVFTTVMLRELGKIASPNLHRGASDEDTFAEFSNNVKILYEDKELPPNTDQSKRAPQIWPIKNISKDLSYVFKIYDASGENFERNLAPSKIDCEFLRASKALIYILDANRLTTVTGDGLAVKIVDNLASYLRKANPKFKGIIKIPIAVVLAKFDTISNHPDFSKRAIVYGQSNTIVDGKLNIAEIDQVDAEIKRWLEDNNCIEILRSFEASFSDYRFFGVSSLGTSPNDDATLPHPPKSHRVLDPVLWLFKKEKFID